MIDLVKKFFSFFLPLLRRAALEVTADVITKAAYPDRPVRRVRPDYSRYNRMTPEDQDQAKRVARAPKAGSPNWYREQHGLKAPGPFHDVLMVAFDLTGPNAALAHQWLMEQMPKPGLHPAKTGDIDLDAWWVADDHRLDGSDCDSAVFVSKGNQSRARELLREHGLVE